MHVDPPHESLLAGVHMRALAEGLSADRRCSLVQDSAITSAELAAITSAELTAITSAEPAAIT
jgi:hypothetical protein